MSKDKKSKRPEQISLEEFEKLQAKKAKRKFKIGLPKEVIYLLAIPLVLFIILIIGYLTYIKQFAPAH